jgi:hypothetical protein
LIRTSGERDAIEGRDALGLIDRLRQWSEIQKVRADDEPPGVAGGRDGELLLRELVGSSFRFKDAHEWH